LKFRGEGKNFQKGKKNHKNIWWLKIKHVSLHSQSQNNVLIKHQKKEKTDALMMVHKWELDWKVL